jgi:hypothetical protein
MTTIIPLMKDAAFDAETTKSMGLAFGEACRNLPDRARLISW